MTFLDQIISQKRIEIEELGSIKDLKAKTSNRSADDVRKIHWSNQMDVIAEIKRKSPSKGELAIIKNPSELAKTYEKAGACVISVLTDREFFGAKELDFTQVRSSVSVPILRKDFIIDEKQVYESYLLGADVILLIVSAFRDTDLLKRCYDLAKELSMSVLVETHDLEEVDFAIELGAETIGVNVRNLSTFQEHPEIGEHLINKIPQNTTSVWESSIMSVDDAKRAYKAGADAVLVGQGLVQSEDVQDFIGQIRNISTL